MERPDFERAIEAALAGGPERHHEKTEAQGKLPVRARVEALLDPESLSEDGLLARWEVEGLGADGVITGTGTGPLVVPGTYTVSASSIVDDVETELGGPEPFQVVAIGAASVPGFSVAHHRAERETRRPECQDRCR